MQGKRKSVDVSSTESSPRGGPLRPERYGNERWFVYTRGRPQGGRAPTRGAPTARTIWQRAIGCAHERAPSRGEGRGAPTARTIWQRALVCVHERAPSRGEGTHKGCPYGPNDMATSDRLCTREGAHKGGGHPQGAPLRARTIWQRAIGCAHERAPSRGEGTHKGRPYGPNDMATSDRLCA